MSKKTERLNDELVLAHNKLMTEIRKLKHFGDDCPCVNGSYCELADYYGHDDFPSLGRYCLKCGGNVLI